MQRTEHLDDLIDLGDATIETKGQEDGGIEPGSFRLVTGLTED